jgi:hypothetical protein
MRDAILFREAAGVYQSSFPRDPKLDHFLSRSNASQVNKNPPANAGFIGSETLPESVAPGFLKIAIAGGYEVNAAFSS